MQIPSRPIPGRFTPERLFRPASVAVFGDTPEAARMRANLAGFPGLMPACSPVPEVVLALAAPPDLAVLATAPGQVAGVLAALAARGTGAAIVATALPDLAAHIPPGFGVLGAGSFGLCVPGIGLNASASHIAPRPGRVALVSQSGSLARTVLDWAEPNGVGFSHVVGIGGNDGLGFDTVLDWLSRDPGTGVILLHLSRLQNRRGFVSAARAASRLRPVVAIRPGGRLLDADGQAEAVFVAALRRAGILCVSRLEDLLDAAETLSRARPARRDGLAIVTNSASLGWLAADAALGAGVELAVLPPEARLALSALLPVRAPATGGPPGQAIVHVGTDAPIRLAEAAAMLSARPEVGGVLAILAPSGPDDAAGVAALQACAATVRQPLLACVPGQTSGGAHRRTLAEAGLPAFATPEGAVRGFVHLVGHRHARLSAAELPPRTLASVTPDHDAVTRILARVRAAGRLGLTQAEALAVLDAYGIAVAPGHVATDAAQAAAAATALGFPVVLKPLRSTPGAARGGSVALDLADAAAVHAAATCALAPAGVAAALLVQAQAPRARELRLAVTDDPLFGPAMAFGQGGSATSGHGADTSGHGSAMSGQGGSPASGQAGSATGHHFAALDVAYDLPPLNLALAHALVARTHAGATLSGRTELPDADADALADALVRLSQLVVDRPEIAAIELNPLLAGAHLPGGQGVLAVDAWIGLRAPGEAAFLAIAPYPAQLSRRWTSPRGDAFLIRPIRPEDAEAHAAMFARLSPEDVRFRFFTAMRAVSAEQMARLTQVDYTREMAFVAVREPAGGAGAATPETVGVARLVRSSPGRTGGEGEFAVVVQPDAKGQGVAGTLMRALIDWGRAQAMDRITGLVLADNHPMAAFMRRLGFTLRRLPDEPDVLEAELRLAEGSESRT